MVGGPPLLLGTTWPLPGAIVPCCASHGSSGCMPPHINVRRLRIRPSRIPRGQSAGHRAAKNPHSKVFSTWVMQSGGQLGYNYVVMTCGKCVR